jgi:hypothetical protein
MLCHKILCKEGTIRVYLDQVITDLEKDNWGYPEEDTKAFFAEFAKRYNSDYSGDAKVVSFCIYLKRDTPAKKILVCSSNHNVNGMGSKVLDALIEEWK